MVDVIRGGPSEFGLASLSRVTGSIAKTTRGVVRTGGTACCKVKVTLMEVMGTVFNSRGDMLAISSVFHKRCSVGKMCTNVPDVVKESKIERVIALSVATRRRGGLGRSYRLLGGTDRNVGV